MKTFIFAIFLTLSLWVSAQTNGGAGGGPAVPGPDINHNYAIPGGGSSGLPGNGIIAPGQTNGFKTPGHGTSVPGQGPAAPGPSHGFNRPPIPAVPPIPHTNSPAKI